MKELLKSTRNLTILGVMIGLSIIFVFATVIPAFAASMAIVMFLPTILTGIILGPKAGWLMGTIAGILTLLRALTLPMSPLDPLFINPLVSVLPRMFIGLAAYYLFALVTKKGANTPRIAIGSAVAGAGAMITNTALVMTGLDIFYAQKITETFGVAFKTLLIAVISSNAIIEAVSGAVLTMAITTVYFGVKKRKKA
jgi:uncharacterized membrane protein